VGQTFAKGGLAQPLRANQQHGVRQAVEASAQQLTKLPIKGDICIIIIVLQLFPRVLY
jgi:hypothetical protein